MSDTQTPAPTAPSAPPASVPGGPLQSDAELDGLRGDDFGLDGDMRKQLVDALTERWNPDADPDDQPVPPADTAATPVPAPDPSTTGPSQSQPDEDGAGDGGAAEPQTPAAGDQGVAPPVPAPTPEEVDLNALARDYFGTALTREQSQELFGILGGLQALSPQQRARLDQLIAQEQLGQAPQYPVSGQPDYAPQPQPAPQQQPTPPAPADDPAVSILGPRPDDDYTAQVWDLNARAVRAQQQQIADIQANIAHQTQLDQQRQHEANVARVNSATETWRARHALLNDDEYRGLYQRVEQSGQFPAAVAAHHGDVAAAVESVFDQHFWSDPRFRERAMANAASGRDPMDPGQTDPTSPVAQQQRELEQGRQQLAGSVAAGGGSATPPPGTATPVPSDPASKHAAMVAELQGTHDFT